MPITAPCSHVWMHIMVPHMGLNLFGWSIRLGQNFDQKCLDYIRQRPKIFSKSVPPSGFATYNQGSCLSAPDVHLKTLHLEDSEICHPSKVWHFINIRNYYVLPEGHCFCIAIVLVLKFIPIPDSQERRVLSIKTANIPTKQSHGGGFLTSYYLAPLRGPFVSWQVSSTFLRVSPLNWVT